MPQVHAPISEVLAARQDVHPGTTGASGSPQASWRPRIALVSLPFVSSTRPSIQLGLLGARLTETGFPVQVLHLYLDFARRIGPRLYEALAQHRGAQLGEWLFSPAAFGDHAPDPEGDALTSFAGLAHQMTDPLGLRPGVLLELREEATAYIDETITAEGLRDFDVVGFSSTFQQNVATIAMANRLKLAEPQLITLAGGANCEGAMGRALLAAVPGFDHVISGEAERALPAFLDRIASGGDVSAIPGVLSRAADGTVTGVQAPMTDRAELEALPTPDYREYFDRAARLGLLTGGARATWIPFESSRGCWWGQKHHCTFCGLNALGMPYRAKSPERVLAELAELEARTGSTRFEAVDNIIDTAYLRSLIPRLTEDRPGYTLFYETKANLSRSDLESLAAGGVVRLQPGIESLSTPVLKLMRKGTTSLQNVNLLRWAGFYGIFIAWNLLWGFPGEQEEDYRTQEDLIPSLVHLQPPSGALRVWLERFSPLFSDEERFPRAWIRPEASYSYVYPDSFDLDALAYFFDYELTGTLPDAVHRPTQELVEIWQGLWNSGNRPAMEYTTVADTVQVSDRRLPGRHNEVVLRGLEARLHTACSERPRGISSLSDMAEPEGGSRVEGALQHLVDEGLVLRDGEHYLTLAVPQRPA